MILDPHRSIRAFVLVVLGVWLLGQTASALDESDSSNRQWAELPWHRRRWTHFFGTVLDSRAGSTQV